MSLGPIAGGQNEVATTIAALVAGVKVDRGHPAVAEQIVIDQKPGQRAALQIRLVEPVVLTGGDGRLIDHLYAKVFSELDRGARAQLTLRLLWEQTRAGESSFGLPQPLAASADPAVLLIGPVPGTALANVTDCDAPWEALGRWMARLHLSSPALSRRYDIDGELRTIRRWSAEIATTNTPAALVHRYHQLVQLIEVRSTSIAPTMVGAIHRDLHQEHLIIESPDKVGVVDLDEARLGDPHVDLGHLYAHLTLAAVPPRSIAAMLGAWSSATEHPVDSAALRLAVSFAALKIARQRVVGFGLAPRPVGEARWPCVAGALELAADALGDGILG